MQINDICNWSMIPMFSQQQIPSIPNREMFYNFASWYLWSTIPDYFSIKILESIVSLSGMDDNRIHAISFYCNAKSIEMQSMLWSWDSFITFVNYSKYYTRTHCILFGTLCSLMLRKSYSRTLQWILLSFFRWHIL